MSKNPAGENRKYKGSLVVDYLSKDRDWKQHFLKRGRHGFSVAQPRLGKIAQYTSIFPAFQLGRKLPTIRNFLPTIYFTE